ncbi:MAG: hypothetical protein K9J42_13400 [Sulfuritalea sp.]|nr:hypothetical protein [Sulfuritalea sp.]
MSSFWELYEYQPSFVIGFHGCDEKIGEGLLSGRQRHLNPSRKKWDWLGHGIYFWEGNPQRAEEWALDRVAAGQIKVPFVIGAVIDLRHCLNLLDSSGQRQVKDAHKMLEDIQAAVDLPMPENKGGKDKAVRMLDCLVINSLHDFRAEKSFPAYDSVRAMFPEGDSLYPDAGFQDKSHIQLCIRNKACIKGYFRPITS